MFSGWVKEDDMFDLIEKLKFKSVRNPFQEKKNQAVPSSFLT